MIVNVNSQEYQTYNDLNTRLNIMARNIKDMYVLLDKMRGMMDELKSKK